MASLVADDEVQAQLEMNLQLVTPEDVAAGTIGVDPIGGWYVHTWSIGPTDLWSVVGVYEARVWEWNECTTTEDDEEGTPAFDSFMTPADFGTLLPTVKAEDSDGSYVQFDLAVNNWAALSTPMPEPGDDGDLDPKRRRIVVDATGFVLADDVLSPNDHEQAPVHLRIDVDPWYRIRSSDSWYLCAGDDAAGELVAEARLLDDLETVRVTLKSNIYVNTDCHREDSCGEERAVFDVPRDGSVFEDELQVNAYCNPITPWSGTYARFTDISIQNTQAPAP